MATVGFRGLDDVQVIDHDQAQTVAPLGGPCLRADQGGGQARTILNRQRQPVQRLLALDQATGVGAGVGAVLQDRDGDTGSKCQRATTQLLAAHLQRYKQGANIAPRR
jgi:hypothetical protein